MYNNKRNHCDIDTRYVDQFLPVQFIFRFGGLMDQEAYQGGNVSQVGIL